MKTSKVTKWNSEQRKHESDTDSDIKSKSLVYERGHTKLETKNHAFIIENNSSDHQSSSVKRDG